MKITNKFTHLVNQKVIDNKKVIIEYNNNNDYNVNIIYYIGCIFNKNWKSWLNPINLLKQHIKKFNLYLFLLIDNKDDKDNIKKEIEKLGVEKLKIIFLYKNKHEYRPLLKLWDLSKINNKNTDLFLYFHSKEITRNKECNISDNLYLLIKDFEKIKDIYNTFPTIDKIGFKSSNIGFCWFNFWWARGSYISKIEKPLLTERRHYYEDWLFRKLKDNHKYDLTKENPINSYDYTFLNTYMLENKEGFYNIGSFWAPDKIKWYNY